MINDNFASVSLRGQKNRLITSTVYDIFHPRYSKADEQDPVRQNVPPLSKRILPPSLGTRWDGCSTLSCNVPTVTWKLFQDIYMPAIYSQSNLRERDVWIILIVFVRGEVPLYRNEIRFKRATTDTYLQKSSAESQNHLPHPVNQRTVDHLQLFFPY